MNRPLHLARKDARRLACGLGLWLVLFPIPATLLVLHATGRLDSLSPKAPEVLGSVHLVLYIAGFLLAVQLALEDPLHGADAGWRTRPITVRDLLLAKLGLAGATLVAAPTALLALVWMAAGFGPRDIATLALDQAAVHALIAGFGLLLGALTRNLGQALLWLTAALPGLALAAGWPGERSHRTALLAAAFPAVALALRAAYRPRSSRGLSGGLGFAGAALVTLGIFASVPDRPVWSAPSGPGQALSVGTEARLGAEHLRLVRMEPDPKSSTPLQPMLRLEWRGLAPHGILLPGGLAASSPHLVRVRPGQPGQAPSSALIRSSRLAGIQFTFHELRLPAAQAEGAIWSPAATR